MVKKGPKKPSGGPSSDGPSSDGSSSAPSAQQSLLSDGTGLVFGFFGWLLGGIGSIAFVTALASAFDYDLAQPGGTGAAIGRSAMQLAEGRGLEDNSAPIQFLAVTNIPLWLALAVTPFLVARLMGVDPRRWLALHFVSPHDVILGLGLGVLAQWAVTPVYWLLFTVTGEQDVGAPARQLAERAHGWGVVVFILMVVLIAPVTEELFFRGLVFRSLERMLPAPVALVGSALIFAAVHFQLLQSLALTLLGLLLAGLVHRTGRLAPAVIAHAAFNATTVVNVVFLV